MLGNIIRGFSTIECSRSSTTTDGATITANATINTEGNYSDLFASSSRDSYGILLNLHSVGSTGSNSSMLVDIALTSTVIIPDLLAGYAALPGNTEGGGYWYYFPIFIPSGSNIRARCQAAITNDTVIITAWLMQRPVGPGVPWTGTRVTAYGANAADSGGVSTTAGNNVYGTAGTMSASTTNPIRYMQLGWTGGTDTSLSDYRAFAEIRLGASTAIAGPLPFQIDSVEVLSWASGNLLLSQMAFDLPSGQDLRVATQVNGSVNLVHDLVLYGVD